MGLPSLGGKAAGNHFLTSTLPFSKCSRSTTHGWCKMICENITLQIVKRGKRKLMGRKVWVGSRPPAFHLTQGPPGAAMSILPWKARRATPKGPRGVGCGGSAKQPCQASWGVSENQAAALLRDTPALCRVSTSRNISHRNN